MRVLINAASANMGGAVTYLQNVVRWLPEVAPDDDFIVYAPPGTIEKLAKPGALSNVRLESYPYSATGGGARVYFDQAAIPRLIRQYKTDLLFSSTGFGTFFSPCPQVLLVRNPVYFSKDFHTRYRELERSLRRNTIRRWHSLLSIRSADTVLFPTLAMQDMVEQYLPLGKKRTEAIHYGFDHDAFKQNGGAPPPIMQAIRRWKSEGHHVLLNVSTYAVHKNFETLIEALAILAARGVRVKMLTTTSREKTTDRVEYDALRRRASELGVDEAWHELGYVPYNQLHVIYSHADIYVFPSFTESFGHSLVEAMAAGLPVIAADMPVNREVCGDAGAYFGIYDPEDCASKIEETLIEPDRKKELASHSILRSSKFSWQQYTGQIVQIFREAYLP